MAATTVILMAAGGSLLAASSASAAGVVSTGQGQFLSGSALTVDLASLANLAPASATNTTATGSVTSLHPLDVTALNAVEVNVGPGINLLGQNGVLALGAVNQFATARNDGSSLAATGAVTNAGAIGVGGQDGVPQSDASLDLSGLIGPGLAASLANLRLNAGALSSTASETAGGTQTGDYQIAGLDLTLTSPVLASTTNDLRTTVAGLQPVVDAVPATLNALPLGGLVTVTGTPNLTTIVDTLTTVTSADGSIAANLRTGAVTIDVAKVLTSAGLDLNNLPANTELLPYITAALTSQLLPAVTSALTGVTTQLTNAIGGITATVLGIPINAGVLTGVLTPVINTVVAPVDTAVAGLGTTLITPLATSLDGVVSLRANVQETAGGIFTERALRIGVVDATPVAVVNLASSSVGPNAGPAAAVPVAASIDPDHGPVTGGTPVTITGTGFVAGSTVSVDGGAAITPTDIAPDGTTVTFTTPAHAVGGVPVTVTTPGGTTDPLTYTYVAAVGPVPTTSAIDPNHGPAAGGTVVTITGTGFTPDTTVSVDGGPAITPTDVATDGTAVTFTTPAHVAGAVRVTATTPGGTSNAQTYTYDPAVTTTPPVITDPSDGSTVTTSEPPISGTGTPGATVTVYEGTTIVCTAVVAADGGWTCKPTTPFPSGRHTITATQTGVDGTSPSSAPVHFTVLIASQVDTAGSGPGATLTDGGGDGTLAYTGSNVTPGIILAAIFVTLGLALTAAGWRSRRVRP